jgi:hypothetical protein
MHGNCVHVCSACGVHPLPVLVVRVRAETMAEEYEGTAPAGDETEIDSKRLQLEQKRMFFNLKQNNRGKFLKVRPAVVRGAVVLRACLASIFLGSCAGTEGG